MVNIYEILVEIESYPGLYLGYKCIERLDAFFEGWHYGRGLHDRNEPLLVDFDRWVRQQFRITSQQSMYSIMRFVSYDPADAVDRYFEMLHRFCNEEDEAETHREEFKKAREKIAEFRKHQADETWRQLNPGSPEG